MKKTTISVAIATYNEEKFIAKCLDAVKSWVNEIVIVDGQSSDKTAQIVKKYPKARLISTTNKAMFHINKQMAIDACKSDWILQLDADEIVSPKLQKEILQTIPQTEYNGFWIKRQNYFLGRFLKKGGVYPDPTIRLYRHGMGRLPCKDVHEQAVVKDPVSTLNHDLLHYADPTFSRYLLRNDLYTSLLASDFKKAGLKTGFFSFIVYFIFKPLTWFFLAYFRHKGFMDGFPGFVFAWYSSLRFPIAYIKVFEMEHEKV